MRRLLRAKHLKGLTPGKSTKVDVGRVLGLQVRSLSETLIEYNFPDAGGKAYVQYRDKSPSALVERIELTCEGDMWQGKCHDAMRVLEIEHVEGNVRDSLWPDAVVGSFSSKNVIYYGDPRFVVITGIRKDNGINEQRLAFYSGPLYEAAKPKGGCSGSIFGEWETNRARMLIERVSNLGFKGTYSENNGTFMGKYDDKATIRHSAAGKGADGFNVLTASFVAQTREGAFVGEWKDGTGNGTMTIPFEFAMETFKGTWTRTSGTGPSGGTWEGRCVGSKQ